MLNHCANKTTARMSTIRCANNCGHIRRSNINIGVSVCAAPVGVVGRRGNSNEENRTGALVCVCVHSDRMGWVLQERTVLLARKRGDSLSRYLFKYFRVMGPVAGVCLEFQIDTRCRNIEAWMRDATDAILVCVCCLPRAYILPKHHWIW